MQISDVGGVNGSGQQHVPQQIARDRITLDPLHALRAGALDAQGIPEIIKIILIKLSSRWDNAFSEVTTREAEDIFESAAAEGEPYDPVPEGAVLTHAIFSIQFADSSEPRYVTVVPPWPFLNGRCV